MKIDIDRTLNTNLKRFQRLVEADTETCTADQAIEHMTRIHIMSAVIAHELLYSWIAQQPGDDTEKNPEDLDE